MQKCPACGHDAPENSIKCPNCGLAVPTPGAVTLSEVLEISKYVSQKETISLYLGFWFYYYYGYFIFIDRSN